MTDRDRLIEVMAQFPLTDAEWLHRDENVRRFKRIEAEARIAAAERAGFKWVKEDGR